MDKETLQKKIESGDTVWAFSWASGKKRIVELNLQENEPEIDNYLLYFWDKDLIEHRYDFESIFATKEEAEWQLEFGDITRTEKLELPTWEDTNTEQFYVFGWWHNDGELAMRRFDADYNREYLIVEHESDKYERNYLGRKVKKVFKKPYNHENYLEACRLCKKLFLGEDL